MGLQFKDLVVKEEIAIKDLTGKILAVDTMNLLYQFLTTIRSADGSVLTDQHGNPTSHLIGLFSRTTTLMQEGLKLAFIFDGKPPQIKQKTWEKRSQIKQEASLKLKEAQDEGDYDNMKKYASRTAVLTKDMVASSKELLTALGCPIIEAPSEGEAQAAHLVKAGSAYACVSQDYDTLIFGCPRIIRNLSIEGRRKKPGTLAYEIVKPEIIELSKVLTQTKLTLEQLQLLAILIGTDYNPGGIKGIGPKKALKLILEHGSNLPALFDSVEWAKQFPDLAWKDLLTIIQTIPVTDNYTLTWNSIDEPKLYDLLIRKHGFSEDRIKTKITKIMQAKKSAAQTGLGKFF